MTHAEIKKIQNLSSVPLLPYSEPEASDQERIYRLRSTFEKQAQFPPGGDIVYTTPAFKAAMKSQNLLDLAIDCQNTRRETSPIAYRYLTQLMAIHSINYVMIFEENEPDYPARLNLTSIPAWEELYKYVLDKHKNTIRECVINRDIQTTRPNRGVAIPFIMQRMQNLYGRKPVVGVDLGCSTNVIWNHIAKNGTFFIENDATFSAILGKNVIQQGMNHTLDIEHITGVDRSNPLYKPGLFNWLLANRHFDEVTSEKIEETRETLINYQNGLSNVTFQQSDIFDTNKIPHNVDVVTAFTMFSQMPDAVAKAGIEVAKSLLNENGILILQDYIREADGITFPEDREFYTYNTFVTGPGLGDAYQDQYLHIASFRDTKCTRIKTGSNLDEFISLTQ
ncbi:MAG TPA: hypothetical protein PLS49_01645 [Candidatus Woesebacteria bacterium]|nr:hypothetical protein [Candidatus Woesebacteria bacterium]